MTGKPAGTPGGSDAPKGANAGGGAGGGTSAGELAGLGLAFAVCAVGGLYLGQWLDRKLGTAPWMLLIGVFLGAGGSFFSMYRKLMAAQARDEAARAAKRDDQGPE
jgi:F0F1-type ATP synthase assembly protein I